MSGADGAGLGVPRKLPDDFQAKSEVRAEAGKPVAWVIKVTGKNESGVAKTYTKSLIIKVGGEAVTNEAQLKRIVEVFDKSGRLNAMGAAIWDTANAVHAVTTPSSQTKIGFSFKSDGTAEVHRKPQAGNVETFKLGLIDGSGAKKDVLTDEEKLPIKQLVKYVQLRKTLKSEAENYSQQSVVNRLGEVLANNDTALKKPENLAIKLALQDIADIAKEKAEGAASSMRGRYREWRKPAIGEGEKDPFIASIRTNLPGFTEKEKTIEDGFSEQKTVEKKIAFLIQYLASPPVAVNASVAVATLLSKIPSKQQNELKEALFTRIVERGTPAEADSRLLKLLDIVMEKAGKADDRLSVKVDLLSNPPPEDIIVKMSLDELSTLAADFQLLHDNKQAEIGKFTRELTNIRARPQLLQSTDSIRLLTLKLKESQQMFQEYKTILETLSKQQQAKEVEVHGLVKPLAYDEMQEDMEEVARQGEDILEDLQEPTTGEYFKGNALKEKLHSLENSEKLELYGYLSEHGRYKSREFKEIYNSLSNVLVASLVFEDAAIAKGKKTDDQIMYAISKMSKEEQTKLESALDFLLKLELEKRPSPHRESELQKLSDFKHLFEFTVLKAELLKGNLLLPSADDTKASKKVAVVLSKWMDRAINAPKEEDRVLAYSEVFQIMETIAVNKVLDEKEVVDFKTKIKEDLEKTDSYKQFIRIEASDKVRMMGQCIANYEMMRKAQDTINERCSALASYEHPKADTDYAIWYDISTNFTKITNNLQKLQEQGFDGLSNKMKLEIGEMFQSTVTSYNRIKSKFSDLEDRVKALLEKRKSACEDANRKSTAVIKGIEGKDFASKLRTHEMNQKIIDENRSAIDVNVKKINIIKTQINALGDPLKTIRVVLTQITNSIEVVFSEPKFIEGASIKTISDRYDDLIAKASVSAFVSHIMGDSVTTACSLRLVDKLFKSFCKKLEEVKPQLSRKALSLQQELQDKERRRSTIPSADLKKFNSQIEMINQQIIVNTREIALCDSLSQGIAARQEELQRQKDKLVIPTAEELQLVRSLSEKAAIADTDNVKKMAGIVLKERVNDQTWLPELYERCASVIGQLLKKPVNPELLKQRQSLIEEIGAKLMQIKAVGDESDNGKILIGLLQSGFEQISMEEITCTLEQASSARVAKNITEQILSLRRAEQLLDGLEKKLQELEIGAPPGLGIAARRQEIAAAKGSLPGISAADQQFIQAPLEVGQAATTRENLRKFTEIFLVIYIHDENKVPESYNSCAFIVGELLYGDLSAEPLKDEALTQRGRLIKKYEEDIAVVKRLLNKGDQFLKPLEDGFAEIQRIERERQIKLAEKIAEEQRQEKERKAHVEKLRKAQAAGLAAVAVQAATLTPQVDVVAAAAASAAAVARVMQVKLEKGKYYDQIASSDNPKALIDQIREEGKKEASDTLKIFQEVMSGFERADPKRKTETDIIRKKFEEIIQMLEEKINSLGS